MSEETDIVERARALVSAATPGPWKYGWDQRSVPRDGFSACTFAIGPQHGTPVNRCTDKEAYDRAAAQRNADAALIAAAPELLTALADEVERAWAERHKNWETARDMVELAQAERDTALAEVGRLNSRVKACTDHTHEEFAKLVRCQDERDAALAEVGRLRAFVADCHVAANDGDGDVAHLPRVITHLGEALGITLANQHIAENERDAALALLKRARPWVECAAHEDARSWEPVSVGAPGLDLLADIDAALSASGVPHGS